jgi:hypothetical protein
MQGLIVLSLTITNRTEALNKRVFKTEIEIERLKRQQRS